MKLSALQILLASHPDDTLAFTLPGGKAVALHAHVTEVGLTEKHFLDCGGRLNKTAFCSLQIWVADDFEHRLAAGKLAAIIDKAAPLFGERDPEVQVECQDGSISLFSIESGKAEHGLLAFTLAAKQTACLAMEVCVPSEDAAASEEQSCCSGSTCC